MTSAINIAPVASSASPANSSSIHNHIRILRHKDSAALDYIRQPKILHPIENEGLRLLILENISQEAVRAFRAQGYHVDHYTKAFSEEELIEKISQYHAIGIRSKTKITKRVLAAASKVSHPITSLDLFLFILEL
jgi:D-3-phosphoglycerate dehydrogenase